VESSLAWKSLIFDPLIRLPLPCIDGVSIFLWLDWSKFEFVFTQNSGVLRRIRIRESQCIAESLFFVDLWANLKC